MASRILPKAGECFPDTSQGVARVRVGPIPRVIPLVRSFVQRQVGAISNLEVLTSLNKVLESG